MGNNTYCANSFAFTLLPSSTINLDVPLIFGFLVQYLGSLQYLSHFVSDFWRANITECRNNEDVQAALSDSGSHSKPYAIQLKYLFLFSIYQNLWVVSCQDHGSQGKHNTFNISFKEYFTFSSNNCTYRKITTRQFSCLLLQQQCIVCWLLPHTALPSELYTLISKSFLGCL